MKLISFDIGIKNMAYCIFNTSNNTSITNWDVINLMETEIPTQLCTCSTVSKSKKLLTKPCIKLAKYSKNGTYYCDKHAKECSQFIIPKKCFETSNMKKLKIDDLIKFGNSHLCFINVENLVSLKKPQLLLILKTFFETKCLESVIVTKSKTAGETDLIDIGKNMKTLLNATPNIDDITHVVIENQISPIATRMKTIQGMLAQYFIMKNSDIVIEFVSSSHKLKQFSELNLIHREPVIKDNTSKINPKYKQNKIDGIFYCSRMIDSNDQLSSWKWALNTKKKDDLADCFLQGIWYLKHQNAITYDNALKITVGI